MNSSQYSRTYSLPQCLVLVTHTPPVVSRQQGLKTAVIEGHDIGGTCVNRGCVPSKALLAASGRVRELQSAMHLKALGIQVSQ